MILCAYKAGLLQLRQVVILVRVFLGVQRWGAFLVQAGCMLVFIPTYGQGG
jgi:hypothetical protein